MSLLFLFILRLKPALLLQSHVHLSSKHCQVCQKCVIGFDHHCLWLNCCIGSRNYTQFITLLCLSILLFSMYLTVATIHFVKSYIEPTSAHSSLIQIPREATQVCLGLPSPACLGTGIPPVIFSVHVSGHHADTATNYGTMNADSHLRFPAE